MFHILFLDLRLKNVFLFAFLQRIMRLGFDWDTTDMSIMLLAKLAMPLMGTARIVINSLHIKGDVCKAASFSSFFLVQFISNQFTTEIIYTQT